MNKCKLLLLLLFAIVFMDTRAQSVFTGNIIDSLTREPLIGASVYIPMQNKGVATNELGQFAIDAEVNEDVRAEISYVGYRPKIIVLQENSLFKTIELSANLALDEVTILADSKKYQIGRLNISSKALLRSVQFGSEPDIIKSLQLLPSITFGAEGSSNIYVRGGSADENLVLLDDVPVFNTNHLFGLVSTIDPNVIETSDVYTGALPARYGGKLSSVIGLRSSGAFSEKWQGKFRLGLLSTKVYLKGSVFNKNINIELSARRSLVHLLGSIFQSEGNNKFGFSDYYGKAQIKLGQYGRLSMFYYNSKDWNNREDNSRVEETNDRQIITNRLNWANELAGSSLHYQLSNRLYSKTSIYTSSYNFGLFGSTEEPHEDYFQSSFYTSDIKVYGVKQDLIWEYDQHKINMGLNASIRKFNPGRISSIRRHEGVELDSTTADISEKDKAIRFFAEYEYRYKKLGIIAGANMVSHVFDTSSKWRIEPRIRLSYSYNKKTVFEASYGRSNQLYNIFNTSTLGLPTDSFVPTQKGLTSPRVQIGSIGMKTNAHRTLDFQTEIYYKISNGLNAIKPGNSTLIFGETWRNGVVSDGQGKSYGIEMMLTKHTGRLTGWLAYTLSKTTRQFDEINQGHVFDFKFGRPHDLKLTANYAISNSLRLSMNFIYARGQAVTLPIGIFPSHLAGGDQIGSIGSAGIDNFFEIPIRGTQPVELNTFFIYGKHNGNRFPDYHRLDVSLEKSWQSKYAKQYLHISIYNVYRRLNTYYITSGYESGVRNIKNETGNYSSVNLFPLIPSISYSIEF